jgi:chromosome segregation ATPase
MLQESIQQRVVEESGVTSKDYQTVVDTNQFLERQLEEFTSVANQANDARLKAEQAKKNALDQLHALRQEAEIQREDLRSAEVETKKAWKIVGETNSKASAQAKELKEAQEAKIDISAKAAALQRSLDQLNASTKFDSLEKSRLETEISTLSRRLKMEQELTRRAEAELAAKSKEVGDVKRQDIEISQAKVASIVEQKGKLEAALKDWQARHADVTSRLDATESYKSRAVLEIEDLVKTCSALAYHRTMNSLDLNKSVPLLNDLLRISRYVWFKSTFNHSPCCPKPKHLPRKLKLSLVLPKRRIRNSFNNLPRPTKIWKNGLSNYCSFNEASVFSLRTLRPRMIGTLLKVKLLRTST